MGQGQSDTALRLLQECSSSGAWLCLKNLHLVTAWLVGRHAMSVVSLNLWQILVVSFTRLLNEKHQHPTNPEYSLVHALPLQPTLEKALNRLEPHEDFRLWLTSEPHPKFSVILLQMSLKVTYEVGLGGGRRQEVLVFGLDERMRILDKLHNNKEIYRNTISQ